MGLRISSNMTNRPVRPDGVPRRVPKVSKNDIPLDTLSVLQHRSRYYEDNKKDDEIILFYIIAAVEGYIKGDMAIVDYVDERLVTLIQQSSGDLPMMALEVRAYLKHGFSHPSSLGELGKDCEFLNRYGIIADLEILYPIG